MSCTVYDMWEDGEPTWLLDLAMLGALARLPARRRGVSQAQLRADARRLLRTQGDRGWGELIETLTLPHLISYGKHWLTGRTWVKGARMLEVMEAAQLSPAESPRYTSQLWRQLCKDQRTWLTKSLIEAIDGEYPRDLWKWFDGLDLMRASCAPRT